MALSSVHTQRENSSSENTKASPSLNDASLRESNAADTKMTFESRCRSPLAALLTSHGDSLIRESSTRHLRLGRLLCVALTLVLAGSFLL